MLATVLAQISASARRAGVVLRAVVDSAGVPPPTKGSFTDPENARAIYLAASGLLVVAVVVALGTVWWWRSTRAEHPSLAPLEVMGSKVWREERNDMVRRVQLDAVRPSVDHADRNVPLPFAPSLSTMEPRTSAPIDPLLRPQRSD